jgi:hypothetical protein
MKKMLKAKDLHEIEVGQVIRYMLPNEDSLDDLYFDAIGVVTAITDNRIKCSVVHDFQKWHDDVFDIELGDEFDLYSAVEVLGYKEDLPEYFL